MGRQLLGQPTGGGGTLRGYPSFLPFSVGLGLWLLTLAVPELEGEVESGSQGGRELDVSEVDPMVEPCLDSLMWSVGSPREGALSFNYTLFICVCRGCILNTQHLKVRGQLPGVFSPSTAWILRKDGVQVLGLGGCHLYLMNHLAGLGTEEF